MDSESYVTTTRIIIFVFMVLLAFFIPTFVIAFLLYYNIEKLFAWIYGKGLFTFSLTIGKSMEPALPSGLNITFLFYPIDVQVGDIVVYKKDELYIQHRVIGNTMDGYIVKGDNNPVFDGEIKEENIMYKVVTIGFKPIYIPISLKSIRKTLSRL